MNKIVTSKSEMSVSFYIFLTDSLATSEISMFPKDLAFVFINDSDLNIKQKDYLHEIVIQSNEVYFFNRLKVAAKSQNNGIGTKLLKETLNFIKESNGFLINPANAYGEKSQEDLIKFYQKNGMILINENGCLVYQKDILIEDLNALSSK